MKYLLLSSAKFLSLALLSSLFLSRGQAQESYGLYHSDGSVFGVISYEDSSFLSVLYRSWGPGSAAYRFAWSRFSETNDTVIFHSSPFASLSKYHLWESRALNFKGYGDYKPFCYVEDDSIVLKYGHLLEPVFSIKDTSTLFFVVVSMSSFSCIKECEERMNSAVGSIPSDSIELKFKDSKTIVLPCIRSERFTRKKSPGTCYTCKFKIPKRYTKLGKIKALRLLGDGEALPWYKLEVGDDNFIELVYLYVEKKGKLSKFYSSNEHFYDMSSKIAERLNDSTWVFEGDTLKVRLLQEKPRFGNFVSKELGSPCTFKYRPNDPAFNFKVLDLLPRGCTDKMRQYSPHLDKPKPEKPPTQHKRRE